MMKRIFKLRNTIQPYAWGSKTALAELLGQPSPSLLPQAELWMGAHSKAPSKIWYQGRWQNLDELIRGDATSILGPAVVQLFGDNFPFLFKVLAVEQPLSIQAHPNKVQARHGFLRENEAGIALHAAHRNYRDDRHKPELLCALTPFWALCGFRDPQEMIAGLGPLWPDKFRDMINPLRLNGALGIRHFFAGLLQMSRAVREDLTGHVASVVDKMIDQSAIYRWIAELSKTYPGDPGILAPALLNLFCLQPGQAIFLPAGRLHAYLKGMALEVMANSDNVLRGGLTSKHIDIEELLNILDFSSSPVEISNPDPISATEVQYPCPVEEFSLSIINLEPGSQHVAVKRFPVSEILLCIEGEAIFHCEDAKSIPLKKGESFLITAGIGDYHISGRARIYKAMVGYRGV